MCVCVSTLVFARRAFFDHPQTVLFAGAAHKAMPKRPTEEQMERAVAAGDPDPRALRVRGRAFQADGDPVPHAAVDSQTRSAQTLAARQRRRDAVSTAAPRSSLQNSSTHAKDIA